METCVQHSVQVLVAAELASVAVFRFACELGAFQVLDLVAAVALEAVHGRLARVWRWAVEEVPYCGLVMYGQNSHHSILLLR